MPKRIGTIFRRQDGSYAWTAMDEDGNVTEYTTDSHGDGMWARVPSRTEWRTDEQPVMVWRQVRGTADFRIGNVSASTRRARVVAQFAEQEAQ